MMKVRDILRDEYYFSKGIDFKQSLIDQGKEKVYPRPEGQALHVSELFDNAVHLLIQRYGRGDSLESLLDSTQQALDMRKLMMEKLEEIKAECPSVVNMYSKLDLYNYYNTFAILSFIVATGGSSIDITRALEVFDYRGQDLLFDRVAILLGDVKSSKNVSEKLVFPKVYTPLLAVIDAGVEQRSILMKEFIDGWYKRMRPIAWHSNDKAAEGAYFGYWCFEAALVVNLLNIDDSSFRDNVYYPKDLIVRK